jgi:hypothetical protein
MALRPNRAIAQQPEHYGHRELRRLMANAKNPDEYQKLAKYFHYRELFYRAKAQREIDAYANCVPNYPMAAKFLTRADITARLYDHYLFKAGENAKLAGRYDEMLTRLGIKPASESAMIVSVKSLQNASAGTAGSALMGRPRPAVGLQSRHRVAHLPGKLNPLSKPVS